MYSVEFTKVHAINEGRFVQKMYPRLNSRCKPAATKTEAQASKSWNNLYYHTISPPRNH